MAEAMTDHSVWQSARRKRYQAHPINDSFTLRDLFHLAWTFLAALVLFAAAMAPLILGLFGAIEGGY